MAVARKVLVICCCFSLSGRVLYNVHAPTTLVHTGARSAIPDAADESAIWRADGERLSSRQAADLVQDPVTLLESPGPYLRAKDVLKC